MQQITPCLWFDGNAEEAVAFYMSIFQDSKIVGVMRRPAGAPGRAGDVLALTAQLRGLEIIALNGGPEFTFTPAISLFVTCATQAEVDRFWEQLSQGGETNRCGWLKDKYGVSWQIVPAVLGEMLRDPDTATTGRVMQALLTMDRLDIAGLRRAYQQA